MEPSPRDEASSAELLEVGTSAQEEEEKEEVQPTDCSSTELPYTAHTRPRNSQLVVATPIEDPSYSSTTNHDDDDDVEVVLSEGNIRNNNNLLLPSAFHRTEEGHLHPSFEDPNPPVLVHAKPADVTDSAMDVVRSRRGRWLLFGLILVVVLVAGGSAFRLVSNNDANGDTSQEDSIGNSTMAASGSSHATQPEEQQHGDGSMPETAVPAMPQPPTTAPSNAPKSSSETTTNTPTTDVEASFVALLPQYTRDALEDVVSPQSRALRWLLEDHPPEVLTNYTDYRKLQRFALASFYYATNGQGWDFRQFWLTLEDECLWWSYLQLSTSTSHRWKSVCNQKGEYSFLLMDENRLIGTIVPELALLSSLQEISLVADNFFVNDKETELLVGSIPSEIGLLTNLQLLAVGKNWLSSPIPSELGQLSNSLHTLSLLENAIKGPLPSEIGLLFLLSNLIVYSNQLTQILPSELGMLSSSLVRLDANQNQFTGSLPTSLGRLTELVALKLQENAFSGSIPSEIGLLKPLSVLHLQENRLVGFIPPEFGNMNQLTQLWLGYNQLTGSLPTEISGMRNLRTLLLNDNNLSGSIVTEIGMLRFVRTVRLSNNLLTGSVGSQVCALEEASPLAFRLVVDCEEVECSCDCVCFGFRK